jgi:hypothetical protein
LIQAIDLKSDYFRIGLAHNLNVAVRPTVIDGVGFVQDGFPQQRG